MATESSWIFLELDSSSFGFAPRILLLTSWPLNPSDPFCSSMTVIIQKLAFSPSPEEDLFCRCSYSVPVICSMIPICMSKPLAKLLSGTAPTSPRHGSNFLELKPNLLPILSHLLTKHLLLSTYSSQQ